MGSIIKKIKKGKPYYYAVECKRVEGKPRIVWQKYLGTFDNILEKCSKNKNTADNVSEVDIFEAGGVAAMLRVAQKLNLVEIIDNNIPKRQQGASIGQYILLAAINRVLAPCSKLQMPDWYQKSVLYRLWKYSPDTFTSQSFWNNMDTIPEESLDIMQEQIALRLKTEFGIDPKALLYDTTNFFTYIATGNKRNTIAQRGRNKVKRNDLRQVGLALMVSKDFQIPLFHKTYQGNAPDRGLFPEVSTELVNWKKKVFGKDQESTLIFDKGNISEEAMENLIVPNQNFVCAVPKANDPELFATHIKELKEVSGLPGTKSMSLLVEIWNKKLKAVVAYSESFYTSELCELTEALRKAQDQLLELSKWLEKGPKTKTNEKLYTQPKVKEKIREILSKSHLKEIIRIAYDTETDVCRINYSVDQNMLAQISATTLGRTLIFSSNLDWTDKEIISAYRSQQCIEEAFKWMKNREYLHWQPAFHWTDQKIKVHSFYCVMALLLATLAHKTVVQKGIDIPLLQMLDELSDIREVALIHSKDKRVNQKDRIVLSRMSPKQRKLSEALEIEQVLAG